MPDPVNDPRTSDQARAIAAANDTFRRTATSGIVFTATLAAEGPVTMALLLARVRAFDAFTPDNDPYGEHDYGSFEHALSMGGSPRTETILWKIDIFADASLTAGADDPLSPSAVRILTVMHASDY